MNQIPLGRRAFIGGSLAVPLLLPHMLRAQVPFADNPFTLGLASGDPAPDGFVIWTRLAPRPREQHGGMPAAAVPVNWEVSEDDRFRTIAAKGEALARPELGHSVHVEVAGLKPGRPYWYRFDAGGERSYTGRSQTLPATGAALDRVRFASVGCQHYETGFFTAFRHMADEELDFVFHSGDYLYEYSSAFRLDEDRRPLPKVRQHLGHEPMSVDDYRLRYAEIKMDTDLQAAHAVAPWFASYDDHEVKNNWVGAIDEDPNLPEVFRLRRAAAMQAWYEHMPVRRRSFPRGDRIDITRRADWGGLLRGHFLDTRLHRTDQPCDDGFKPTCPAVIAPDATVLGDAQEKWLLAGLDDRPRWNLIAQQIMMMPLDRRRDGENTIDPVYNMDSWAGYPAARERILDHLGRRRLANTVVLTGDEHQNWVGEVNADRGRGAARAVEFVGTSITSGGDGRDVRAGNARIMSGNPNLKFTNDQRGYLLCDVTPATWKTRLRVLDRVTEPGAAIATRASFVVEHGKSAVVPA